MPLSLLFSAIRVITKSLVNSLAGTLAICLILFAAHARAQTANGVWRVEIAIGPSEDQAINQMKTAVSDISNTRVLSHQGKFGVYEGTYDTEEEAKAAAEGLVERGVLSPIPVFFEEQGAPIVPSATSGGRFRVLIAQYDSLTAARQRQASLQKQGIFPVDIVEEAGLHRVFAGFEMNTKAEADTYSNNLKKLEITFQDIINLDEPVAPSEPDNSERAEEYRKGISSALSFGDFREAERLLNEWQGLDPSNSEIAPLRQEVATAKAAAEVPVPTPEPPPAVAEPDFATLKSEAMAAENEGRIDEAIATWEKIRSIPDASEAELTEATAGIARLKQQLYADNPPSTEPAAEGLSTKLLAIIGIVVLAIIAGVVVVLKGRKSKATPGITSVPPRAAPPVAAKQQLSMPPKPSSSESETKVPSSKPAAPPEPISVPETERDISLSDDTEIGSFNDEETVRVDADDDGVFLDNIMSDEDLPPLPGPGDKKEPAQTAPAAPASVPIPVTEDNRRIPTVREEKTVPAIHLSEELPETPLTVNQETPKPEKKEKPAATPPPAAPAASKPVPDKGEVPGRVSFYRQGFDDEEVGSIPKNWQGEYDYATLKIVDREDGTGGKCMKFEKLSGSGSAFYTCKFPDAAGRVVVEFDLRCDHKNKYLLGFYVEKDADFRHSIHTVVHRDVANMDKVSLRLQNEAEVYTLGEWVHVRFLIDLPRNIVDGYMNDRPVAVGIRLASKPRMVNTLSIRDNLATEGVLMIDNIQIYQDRPN